ncbi:rRNA maturation RNase YbeY [Filibacter tadaridae]|uniref:Endoribonuclease YbeY n=1 Tax=Filibacter tadaridae TaxID=2483811 RepID=A0A3P5XWE6_9BACL|nr:rRNA maturation RNase YbeY [Filibacter tadaridae]VDC32467.1 Endoribonuclease YbeY [Filibacter tadaridae]
MLELYFDNEKESMDEKVLELIQKILRHAASEEGLKGESEVSVTFMTDEEIRIVNAQYRGKDTPTDVISFALEEMTDGEVAIVAEEGIPTVLGDIIISVETAKRQAEEYGHDFNREIGFLALHGFLHLLGYDHMNEEEEKRMFGRQKEILATLGLER